MDEWGSDHFFSALILFAAIAVLATAIAGRFKFFSIPYFEEKEKRRLTFLQVAGGFGVYILVTIVFYPLMFFLVRRSKETLSAFGEWIQVAYLLIAGGALLAYLFSGKQKMWRVMFPKKGIIGNWRSLGIGALTWLLAYPLVFVVNLITDRIGVAIWGEAATKDQTAVRFLMSTTDRPVLYTLTVLAVIFVVPLTEEILFRGFLQSWLRRFIGKWGGLVVTAIIFSLVHYSVGQQASNFALIISLFALSLFLGYLYEREHTLLGPIGLHATFNAATVLFLAMKG